jgi:hypothetical protein
MATAPAYAASTCSHSLSRSAIAATGSTEVDDVVPTVATIAIGRRPAARSETIAVSSAAGSSSKRSFVAIRTSDWPPRPKVMHALSIEEWASCEA